MFSSVPNKLAYNWDIFDNFSKVDTGHLDSPSKLIAYFEFRLHLSYISVRTKSVRSRYGIAPVHSMSLTRLSTSMNFCLFVCFWGFKEGRLEVQCLFLPLDRKKVSRGHECITRHSNDHIKRSVL